MKKGANKELYLNFNTDEAHIPSSSPTYRTGSLGDGAGTAAGGAAGARAQWGVFLRGPVVWARFLCFLLGQQLIDLHLAGIPQRCVCQWIHICQNPQVASTDYTSPEPQTLPRAGHSPQGHLLGVSPLMSHFIISLTKSPREE